MIYNEFETYIVIKKFTPSITKKYNSANMYKEIPKGTLMQISNNFGYFLNYKLKFSSIVALECINDEYIMSKIDYDIHIRNNTINEILK